MTKNLDELRARVVDYVCANGSYVRLVREEWYFCETTSCEVLQPDSIPNRSWRMSREASLNGSPISDRKY